MTITSPPDRWKVRYEALVAFVQDAFDSGHGAEGTGFGVRDSIFAHLDNHRVVIKEALSYQLPEPEPTEPADILAKAVKEAMAIASGSGWDKASRLVGILHAGLDDAGMLGDLDDPPVTYQLELMSWHDVGLGPAEPNTFYGLVERSSDRKIENVTDIWSTTTGAVLCKINEYADVYTIRHGTGQPLKAPELHLEESQVDRKDGVARYYLNIGDRAVASIWRYRNGAIVLRGDQPHWKSLRSKGS